MTNINEVLKNMNGNTFISIDTSTPVKLAGGKKNEMQGRVKKVTLGANCQIFANKHINGYEAMVKRRLEGEGKSADDFKLGERAWGKRVEGLPIVLNNDKAYLEVIFKSSGETQYFLDDSPIDKESLNLLNKSSSETGQGGLEDKVIIRTFDLNNITKIKCGGVEYFAPFKFVELDDE